MSEINFQPVFDYIDKSRIELKDEILTEVKYELNVKTDSINNKLDYLVTAVDRLDKKSLLTAT